MKRVSTPRLGIALIASLVAVLLLAVSAGAASAQEGRTIGRGFTGTVVSATELSLTIESKGQLFELFVPENTMISNPPDRDVALADLPEPEYKIAGLADQRITDENGIVTVEPLTAVKLTVIPSKATREHKRTIAADKEGEDLTTLDEDGTLTRHAGQGAGIEKGEAIVLLVQAAGKGQTGKVVRSFIKAKMVDERLDRLAQAQTEDPLKIGVLDDLRKKREDLQEKRLERTAENTGSGFKEFVLDTVRTFKETKEERRGRGGVGKILSECARKIAGERATTITALDADMRRQVTEECLNPEKIATAQAPKVSITSPTSGTVVAADEVVTVTAEAKDDVAVVSVTFAVAGVDVATLTAAPYTTEIKVPTGVSSVEVRATALDEDGKKGQDTIRLRVARTTDVGVSITSPAASVDSAGGSRRSTVSGSAEAIAEGDTISVQADVKGTGTITVVFTIDGVAQTPIAAPPYAMRYFVPRTNTNTAPAPLVITAAASDGLGNTATDSVTVNIVRKATNVVVKITEPSPNAKFKGGDTVVINATTNDDSEIAFMTFSVGGVETVDSVAPFSHTHKVPGRTTAPAATSNVPPNVFVGTATLDGRPAPDGTLVVAWIAGSDSSTLSIKATSTTLGGELGSASLSLPVSNAVNAGEATVADGKYVLNAAQPSGQSFNGKTVSFTVGGKDAAQTGTWKQGGADVIDLTAN